MAYVSTQRRPNTSAPSDGSRTITLTGAPPTERGNADSTPNTEPSGAVGSLRLRGSRTRSGPRVSWKDDVVDNEGCGRKSSKVCCIYHKPRPFDESSDEDSDSDSDSDSECTHRHNRPHTGPHREGTSSRRLSGGESMQSRPSGSSLTHQLDDSDSDKNAYEVMPSSRKGKGRC